MGDAIALPFSNGGITSSGWRVVKALHVTSLSQALSTSDYTIGCIINGRYNNYRVSAPHYFPNKTGGYSLQFIKEDGTLTNYDPALSVNISNIFTYTSAIELDILFFVQT